MEKRPREPFKLGNRKYFKTVDAVLAAEMRCEMSGRAGECPAGPVWFSGSQVWFSCCTQAQLAQQLLSALCEVRAKALGILCQSSDVQCEVLFKFRTSVFPLVDSENDDTKTRSSTQYKLVADFPVLGYQCDEIRCSGQTSALLLTLLPFQQITGSPYAFF